MKARTEFKTSKEYLRWFHVVTDWILSKPGYVVRVEEVDEMLPILEQFDAVKRGMA